MCTHEGGDEAREASRVLARKELPMNRMLGAALVLVAAQSGPAEQLASPPLPGFVEGFAKANAAQSIREEVPSGETVEAWTRMVTTQRFTGLAERATPLDYAGDILANVPRSCPGARTSRPAALTVSGRPAVQFQVDCPNSGGRPETFILLAVAGRSDMHVKQVAWRGGTTPATLAWGRGFLAQVRLCGPGATCRR
jgi:hypothetical protein